VRLGPGEEASTSVLFKEGYLQRVILDIYGADRVSLPLEMCTSNEFETEVSYDR